MSRYLFLILLLAVTPLAAQQETNKNSRLTLDRIFVSDDFRGDPVPQMNWLKDDHYTAIQPSKTHPGASDLVRFDIQGKPEVLVPAEKLIPPNAKEPLRVESYELSKDLDFETCVSSKPDLRDLGPEETSRTCPIPRPSLTRSRSFAASSPPSRRKEAKSHKQKLEAVL